jgi:glycosyltransferase involved in cell wall biosynthesis
MKTYSYSIVCPVYNEINYIENLLSFLKAVSPQPEEIFFIDGMSNDGTRAIIEREALKQSRIKLIDNEKKTVPYALNKAIPMCNSDIIVRIDAHSKYSSNYFNEILETFSKVDAEIVGGPTRTAFNGPFQEAVAYVFNTPLGMGNSSVHDVNYTGYTDSVTFGAWKKEIFSKIGLFDLRFKRNQDDEFHYRAKENGFKIFQNSNIKLWYFPRNTLKGLFLQYFEYGLYKPMVLKKNRGGIKLRHIIPSLFVLFLFSLFFAINYSFLITIPLFIYLALILYFMSKSNVSFKSKFLVLPAYLGIHIGYGIGFLFGLFRLYLKKH